MPRLDSKTLITVDDVIMAPAKQEIRSARLDKNKPEEEPKYRPALVTKVENGSIHYAFIAGDGSLEGGGHIDSWKANTIKKVDFAQVRTVVDLPPDLKAVTHEYDVQAAVDAEKERDRLGEEEPDRHPSYGNVSITRVSGHAALFMSPFTHQHFIRFSIRRSSRTRSLSNDNAYGSGPTLVEFSMSEAQFARLFTSLNMGAGAPCTLNYIGGQQMPDCPEQMETERFHKDVERDMDKVASGLDAARKAAEALLASKAPTKKEREAVLEAIVAAQRNISDRMPFVARQLRERMEKVVADGKTELEAFANRTLHSLGLSAIAKAAPTLELKTGSNEKLVEGEKKE